MSDKFSDTRLPRTAVLEMTYRCNHRCLFCSVPWDSPRNDYSRGDEMSLERWRDCVDSLVMRGVRSFSFSGGEPLLKEGLADIIEYAASRKVKEPVLSVDGAQQGWTERNPRLFLVTNGELIDDWWVSFLKRYDITVTVSLPGIESFPELTSGGNPNKVLESLNILGRAGVKTAVGICVSRKNLPELFETISLAFANGARFLLLNRFLPGGRGIDHQELCLDQDQIVQMLDIAEAACADADLPGAVGTELPRCVLRKKYKKIKVGTCCSGGVNFFAVDPSGQVRPCNHSPVKLGAYQDIKSAIAGEYWQKFKRKDFLPSACRGCRDSLRCDGGCREAAHITGGSLDSLDPVFGGKVPDKSTQTKVFCYNKSSK